MGITNECLKKSIQSNSDNVNLKPAKCTDKLKLQTDLIKIYSHSFINKSTKSKKAT